MRELDSNNHSVFSLYYHLVFVVKYRRNVINDDISCRLKEIFEYILLAVSLFWTAEIKLKWTDKSVSQSVLNVALGQQH